MTQTLPETCTRVRQLLTKDLLLYYGREPAQVEMVGMEIFFHTHGDFHL